MASLRRCPPNCVCNNCLRRRLIGLQAASLDRQREIFERAIELPPVPEPPRPALHVPGRYSFDSDLRPPRRARRRYSVPDPAPLPIRRPLPPAVAALFRPPQAPPSTSAPPLNQNRPSTSAAQASASSNRRANFELPPNVEMIVMYLSDALERIQQKLETAGPRRRQCMNEAIRKVIQDYDVMVTHPQEGEGEGEGEGGEEEDDDDNDVPNVEVPTKGEVTIEHLAKDTYVSPPMGVEPEMCVLCQEEYVQGDERVMLPCGHYLHKLCLIEMLQNDNTSTRCPMCRLAFE